MKCMYFTQLVTFTGFITISVRFLQQVNFNNIVGKGGHTPLS